MYSDNTENMKFKSAIISHTLLKVSISIQFYSEMYVLYAVTTYMVSHSCQIHSMYKCTPNFLGIKFECVCVCVWGGACTIYMCV